MITRSETSKYPDLHLRMSATTFENAGEIATRRTILPVNKKTYGPRHIVVSGGFEMIYPDSTEPNESSYAPVVYPNRDSYTTNLIQFQALVDNSKYYCVIPETGYEINYTVKTVLSNTEFILPIGYVCVVVGGTHKVNDIQHNNTYGVYALQNNTALLVPDSNVSVYCFKAVEITK